MEEVKFLKVSIKEATDTLEDCMNRGYDTLNKIRNDYKGHPQDFELRKDQWSSWFNEWGADTLSKLESIYINPSRVHNFREKNSRAPSFDSDTPITGWVTTFDTKINVLKGYYDFIMTTGNPTLNVQGDLVFQQGENIKYEKK